MEVTRDVLTSLRTDMTKHQEHLNRESRYRQAHLHCMVRALEILKDASDCQTRSETNLLMADFRSEMDDSEYYRIAAKEQTVKAEKITLDMESSFYRLTSDSRN